MMERGDEPVFQDGNYMVDGQVISESEFIEDAQSLDNIEYDKY